MKKTINGVIIVEGLHDKNLIQSFYDCDFVITRGNDIPKNEIKYLNNLPNNVKKIILTDSDDAGYKIREKVAKLISNPIDVFVDAKYCNKKGKHGIAESDTEILQKALDQYVENNAQKQNVSIQNLIDYGVFDYLQSNKKMSYLSRCFNLGNVTKNNILKRLNFMNINPVLLKRTILEYDNR